MPKSTDIKRIVVKGRDVSMVKRNGVTLWTPTYGYVYTIENPRIEYASSNEYLSARGYANADDYVKVYVDVRGTLGNRSEIIFTSIVADVQTTSQSWLTRTFTHGHYMATAESRGSVAGAARSANITSISVSMTVDGTTISPTLSCSLSVSQEANVSTAGRTETLPSVVTFKNSSDVYSITTNGYTSNSKCPACGSAEDDSYAVITAYAWIIGGTRQYYSWTSGAEDTYVDTTTRVAVAATRFRFTIVDWEGTYPNRYSWIEPSSWIEPDNDQWQDEAGNFFSNRQRKVLFDNMGDVASNGRSVKIIVEVLKADGTAYPLASGVDEHNDITLYQEANVASTPTYVLSGTPTLSLWSVSGDTSAEASSVNEGEPADWAVITANIIKRKTETFTSGATKVTDIPLSFSGANPTMSITIPSAHSSWITKSVLSSNEMTIYVDTNDDTSARHGYVYLSAANPGGGYIGNIYIDQNAMDSEDEGGEKPEGGEE